MFQIILKDILKFLSMYVAQGGFASIIVFCIVYLGGFLCGKIKPQNSLSGNLIFIKAFTVALLVIYVYIVLGITLLSRVGNCHTVVNLHLFSTFNPTAYEKKYIYENILMFVPLAILIYILAKPCRNIWIALFIGFVSSLAIEVAQLITHLGCFILDDILTNTTGMFIGYVFCRIVEWIYKKCMFLKINGRK